VNAGGGDNTGGGLNFLPYMDAAKLVEGYRSVLKRIYDCEAYYDRVKLYLNRTQPKHGERKSQQQWVTRGNVRAFVTSIVRQGVFSRQRWSYWKFLLTVATRYRHCVGAAMTLAVMGYHLQRITHNLVETAKRQTLAPAMKEDLTAETGGQG
jgi:hypothetical protein